MAQENSIETVENPDKVNVENNENIENNVTSKFINRSYINPVLMTKQQTQNIRYITEDGQHTYYQNNSGSLFYSSKYKNQQIFKSDSQSQFHLISGMTGKKLILIHKKNIYSDSSFKINHSLFEMKIGQIEMKLIGEGINPKFHLNDSWLSYYDLVKKELHFVKLDQVNYLNRIRIKIQNSIDSYFSPQVVMLNSQTILFTDRNPNGHEGIFLFDLTSEKFSFQRKTKTSFLRFELCFNEKSKKILIGTFSSAQNETPQSDIELFNIGNNQINFSLESPLKYHSNKNDVGNIICDLEKDEIYFIQNILSDEGKNVWEVANLDLKTFKTEVRSNFKFVNQLIKIDKIILVPFRGEFYVIEGKSQFNDDSFEKNKGNKE